MQRNAYFNLEINLSSELTPVVSYSKQIYKNSRFDLIKSIKIRWYKISYYYIIFFAQNLNKTLKLHPALICTNFSIIHIGNNSELEATHTKF